MLCLFEQDFLKYYTKAGMDTEELEVGVQVQKRKKETNKKNGRCFFKSILTKCCLLFLFCEQKAVEVMCFVPKRCNDMMNVGRLQGFEVTSVFRFLNRPRKKTEKSLSAR